MFRTAAPVLAIAIAAAAALAPAATAEVVTATNPSPITVPLVGNAVPYPSSLSVEGADGTIADLDVSITFAHTLPDDLDIAIVSPDGDSTILMSDACGTVLPPGGTIVFDDEAPTPLPNSGSCASSAKPTNYNDGDNWTAPGPGLITSTALSSFDGEDTNGVWRLYVVDDTGVDQGTILSWGITATTKKAEIVVPGTGSSGPADPFPSTKAFDTPPGQVISDVDLELNEFFHLHPDDADILLVGPRRGATALVMSDACGSTDVHDYTWIFSDEAPAPMSDSEIAGCNPFTIKPTNFGESLDTFPEPAPAGPYGTALSAFDDLEGGAWQLFVNDDAGGDTGFITGWTVKLTTRDAADVSFVTTAAPVGEGGTALLQVKRSSAAGPATLAVQVKPGSADAADVGTPAPVEFARGETTQIVSVPVPSDNLAEGAETFEVVLASARDDARLADPRTATVTIAANSGGAGGGAGGGVKGGPPSNKIKLGKLTRNAKKGTALLNVEVPGAGVLQLTGKKVKLAKKTAGQAGAIVLPVKPKSQTLDLIEEKGSAKFGIKVTFTPTGGTALTLPKSVKLILND